MAATGFTPISIFYSTTASAVPLAANLVAGELAMNTNDGKLFFKDSSGVVQTMASKGTGSIGGSTTQVQFNNAGVLGGSASLTWSGTVLTSSGFAGPLNGTVGATTANTGAFTTLTAATSITNSSLTTGRIVYTTTGGLETSSANLLYSGTDLTVYGITVGRGAGAVSTNSVVGTGALAANTSGADVAAFGRISLASNTTGGANSGFGSLSLNANTTGSNNTGIGYGALYLNTTGGSNVAVGCEALRANTTSSQNTAVGYQAGYSTTTSFGDVNAFGWRALYSNTTGNSNTAMGSEALRNNTTASNNTAVGYQAAYTNSTGANVTALGYQALYSNTASNNTAVGYLAMNNNTSGTDNVAMGTLVMNSNTTGASNVAIGRQALQANTTASNNTAVGYQAGYSNTTGTQNVFLGLQAGYNATGGYNTIVGAYAGYSLTTGTNNTFVGASSNGAPSAGNLITTGSKNTILGGYNGNQGGLDIRTASNYIVLSDGDGNPRQIIDSSGNVGIGAAPAVAARLELRGTGKAVSWFNSTNTSPNSILMTGGSSYYYGVVGVNNSDNTIAGDQFQLGWSASASGGATGVLLWGRGATCVGLNIAPATSGTGITFPATQNASSDANTLDDYEEGTWTPNQGSGLTVVGAFSSAGVYTKIGNLVYVRGYVQGATSIAITAGGVLTANLPFSNGSDACGGNCTNYQVNQTSGIFIQTGTNVNATSAITASPQVIFGFTYRV